jgi:hypothetical protein
MNLSRSCTDTSLVAGEFQQAMNVILPHSVSLLTNSWPCRVSGCGNSPRATSAGVLTIFLPNNGAYHNSYFSVFDAIISNESLVKKVALYHVVDSSLDYDTLPWLYPSSLATVSGLQLPVTIQGNLFFISQADATAWI